AEDRAHRRCRSDAAARARTRPRARRQRPILRATIRRPACSDRASDTARSRGQHFPRRSTLSPSTTLAACAHGRLPPVVAAILLSLVLASANKSYTVLALGYQ